MTKTDLQKKGFIGFQTIESLMENSCGMVPQIEGVYMILREDENSPTFLEKGTGGFFKEKNPNVPGSELMRNWVEDSPIVYIGKATNLQKRLRQYMRFGQGIAVGHWGGRYIWQLKDSRSLVVCWKPLLGDEDPREVEKEMLQEFKQNHGGRLPFANLVD